MNRKTEEGIMDRKRIAALCVGIFLVSCNTANDSPTNPVDESLSSSSSLDEVSSSSMASSSSATSSSSLRILPPAKIEEDTLRGISADSVRALLRLPATPPAHVQAFMHLWDSLAPSYIDTLLSPSLDSSWMLRESVDQDWCTFEEGPYDVYTYEKEIFSNYIEGPPSITWSTKVYAEGKLVYSSKSYTLKETVQTTTQWSCHSFGIPVEPIGCSSQGVHLAFPDGSHLEAIQVYGYEEILPYIWTPSGTWEVSPQISGCPTAQ